MNRQAWIAGALLVVLGFFIWRNVLRPDAAPGTTDKPKATTAKKVAAEPLPEAVDIPVVAFARATPREGESFASIRNNLFVYEKSPAVIAAEEEARKKAEEAARIAAEEASKRAAEQAARDAERRAKEAQEARDRQKYLEEHPPPPPPPIPPDFKYEYVGVIGPEQGRYAILQDASNAYTFAKAGDVIDKQFKVERVGRLNLDLSFTDAKFDGQLTQVPRQLAAPKAPGASTAPAAAPKPSAPSSRPRK